VTDWSNRPTVTNKHNKTSIGVVDVSKKLLFLAVVYSIPNKFLVLAGYVPNVAKRST